MKKCLGLRVYGLGSVFKRQAPEFRLCGAEFWFLRMPEPQEVRFYAVYYKTVASIFFLAHLLLRFEKQQVE